MMANAPKLRLIQKWGIGVDKIDLEAADRHGIYVTITAGANASVVAEHAIMLIIASLRRLAVAERSMRNGAVGRRQPAPAHAAAGRQDGGHARLRQYRARGGEVPAGLRCPDHLL